MGIDKGSRPLAWYPDFLKFGTVLCEHRTIVKHRVVKGTDYFQLNCLVL